MPDRLPNEKGEKAQPPYGMRFRCTDCRVGGALCALQEATMTSVAILDNEIKP